MLDGRADKGSERNRDNDVDAWGNPSEPASLKASPSVLYYCTTPTNTNHFTSHKNLTSIPTSLKLYGSEYSIFIPHHHHHYHYHYHSTPAPTHRLNPPLTHLLQTSHQPTNQTTKMSAPNAGRQSPEPSRQSDKQQQGAQAAPNDQGAEPQGGAQAASDEQKKNLASNPTHVLEKAAEEKTSKS
ncbi:hypothetical protein K490DRAFT_66522 [Saccharata proteae CBS 121410]|uniref:Uncharacterized protein n=1 Tax=Saccharata proteae CBS 121410 TaxID=1314787 RepID=A0A9P4HRP8_9PEZI|nr:hypothetical protein K490DRAFT_66522 [Saccharata proteae CBS 121410]